MLDPPRTLGERLAEQARLLTRRRTALPGWTAAAEAVTGRSADLARSARIGRERVEVAVPEPVEPPMAVVDAEWPGPASGPDASGHELSGDVTERLRALVGPDLPPLRVRADAAADAVARAHGADAVTMGDEVHFRAGRLAPEEPEGFALLAHEAWHVRQNSTAASWDRATARGRADEEQRAHAHEWAALADGGRPRGTSATSGRHPVPGRVPPPVERATGAHPAVAGAAPAAATAMTAAVDRVVEPPSAAPAAFPDTAELSETIYRDLLRRIKSDVERGG